MSTTSVSSKESHALQPNSDQDCIGALVTEWSHSIAEALASKRARIIDVALAENAVALAMADLRGFLVCDPSRLKWPEGASASITHSPESPSWDTMVDEAERLARACSSDEHHSCLRTLYTGLGLGIGQLSEFPALNAAVTLSARAMSELLNGSDTVHCAVEIRELRLPASLGLLRRAMSQAVGRFDPTTEIYREVVARVNVLLRSFRDDDGRKISQQDALESGTVSVVCPVLRFTHFAVDGSGASASKTYVCPETLQVHHLVGRLQTFSFSSKDITPYANLLQGTVTLGVSDDNIVFAAEKAEDKLHRPQSVFLHRLNTVVRGGNAPMRRIKLPLQEGEADHNAAREHILNMEPNVVVLLSRAALSDLSSVFDRKGKAQRVISLNMFENGIQVREGGTEGHPEVTEPLRCFGGLQLSSSEMKPAVDLLAHAQRLGFIDKPLSPDTVAYTSVDECVVDETLGKHLARADVSAHGLKTLTRCSGPWLSLMLYTMDDAWTTTKKDSEEEDEEEDEAVSVVALRSLALDTRGLNVSEAIVNCCLPSDA